MQVHNKMLNSGLKKNRAKFAQRYASVLDALHAPFLAEAAARPSVGCNEDQSPQSLANSGDSWAVLCTGGASANHVSSSACVALHH